MIARDPIVTALIVAIVLGWIHLDRQRVDAAPVDAAPPRVERLDLDHTVCYQQHMRGWTRIDYANRDRIGQLVRDGKARFTEAETLVCKDKRSSELKEVILREQFYQLIPSLPPRRPPPHD